MKHLTTILIIFVLMQVFLQGCSIRHEKVLATAENPSGNYKAEFVESKILYLFSKKYFLKMTNIKTHFTSQSEINAKQWDSNSDINNVKLIWKSNSKLNIFIDSNLVIENFLFLSEPRKQTK